MARDPYEVLGIDPGASLAQAKAAFHRLAELFHPDRLQSARESVRAEGERRMREVIAAMATIEARAGRPLRAASFAGAMATDRAPGASPRMPRDAEPPFAPSIRIFDAELKALDPYPRLHVRWGGGHARHVLTMLTRIHQRDRNAVRQVEWGAYELILRGEDARHLLRAIAPEDPRCEEPVSVVALASSLRERLFEEEPELGPDRPNVPMGRIFELLEPAGLYALSAESL